MMAGATGPESPSNVCPNAAHYTGAHNGPRRHVRRGYTLGSGLTTQPHPTAVTGPAETTARNLPGLRPTASNGLKSLEQALTTFRAAGRRAPDLLQTAHTGPK
jgi:hypothetical protein